MRPSPGAALIHQWRRSLVVVLLLVPVLSASARQALPERYKKWLERDVAYIITNEEKKVLIDLPSDADRDRFIEHFWEIRNPTPGSPDNSYRSEHYRRIEYAGQYDGKENPRTESGAGAVPGQTVALKRIDAHTAERTTYLKGKKLVTEKWDISADGKTRTVTQSGVDPAGKPVDNVVVYDKQ